MLKNTKNKKIIYIYTFNDKKKLKNGNEKPTCKIDRDIVFVFVAFFFN